MSFFNLEYSDVFAQDDLDLGNVTEIEYAFDTDTAEPVKQRMRRTPACFVDEEEAHPQKMLDAGVIQPSISEWALAQALNTRCFRRKYQDIRQLTAREKHITVTEFKAR
jgi:hypothetical protein